MGRHTDPQTLMLIEQLKQKGETLGYLVTDEYSMLNGLYVADLVWHLAKDQPPLVTFEIETKDSPRFFKNVVKYFNTASAEVPKPFRHYLILVKGGLSEGNRKPLQHYINSYNLSLYEDVGNNKEIRELLFAQLDEMEVNLTELVRRYLSSDKIDKTFQELTHGIQQGMPKAFVQPENVRITFGSEARPDPLRPFKFELSATSPQGSPTLIQRIHDALKRGETMRLTKKDQVKIQVPGLPEGEVEWIEIRPETTKGGSARLETSNYQDSLELLLTGKNDEGHITYTNENQDAPWRATFTQDKKKGCLNVELGINLDKANPHQFLFFYDFMMHAKKENRLILKTNDDKVVFDGPFPGLQQELPETYLRNLRMLADIQLKTQVIFPVPSKMLREELGLLNRLHAITENGVEEASLKSLSIGLTQDEARRRLYLAKNPQIIENFNVILGDQSLPLLGKTIPLGTAKMTVPEARIDLVELEKGVSKGNDSVTLEVSVDPSIPVRIFYDKWAKQHV